MDASDAALQTTLDLARKWLNEPRGLVEAAGYRLSPHPALWIGYHNAQLAFDALQTAWMCCVGGRSMDDPSLQERIGDLRSGCLRYHPDYQVRVLLKAARSSGIPVMEISQVGRIWQIGWGKTSELFFETSSNRDGVVAERIARSKVRSSSILSGMGLPVPAFATVANEDQLARAIEGIGYPCVVKPQDRGGGRGVTTNIRSENTLRAALRVAREYSSEAIMVEQHIAGEDFRVMVVDGRCRAVIQRRPPLVEGDGTSTVLELISKLNATRSASMADGNYLRPVEPDEGVVNELARQNADLSTIPESGRKLLLRSNGNRSTGGTCHNRMDDAHADVRRACERAAISLGARCCGIDIMTPDITRPLHEVGGAIVEVNLTPGVGPMIAAGVAEEDVGRSMVGPGAAAIPVALVLVDREHQLSCLDGIRAGISETGTLFALEDRLFDASGERVNGTRVPWETVRMALRDRTTERLVIFADHASVQSWGLPVQFIGLAVSQADRLKPEWATCLKAHSAEVRSYAKPQDIPQIVADYFAHPKKGH